MKQLLVIAIGAIFLQACSSSQENKPKMKQQIVAGKIVGAENVPVILQSYDGQQMQVRDESRTDKNGVFHLVMEDSVLAVCQIIVDNKVVFPLVLEPNDSIYVQATFPNIMAELKLSNTKNDKILNDYYQQMNTFLQFQQKVVSEAGDVKNDTAEYNRVMRLLRAEKAPIELRIQDYIEKNPASTANILLAQELVPTSGMAYWNKSYLLTLKKMLQAYKTYYPQIPFVKNFESQLASWEASLLQYEKYKEKWALYGNRSFNIAIGEKAPDLVMNNPSGKELKLSSLKGKYVLLDFWASWCGPCRRENPNVVRIYNAYKDKGFTIFSVSLDNDKDKWVAAIQQDKLAWPNHVCDFGGWESFAATLYQITSIPSTVLLDKEGTIIGLNLHGAELEQKLISLLGK